MFVILFVYLFNFDTFIVYCIWKFLVKKIIIAFCQIFELTFFFPPFCFCFIFFFFKIWQHLFKLLQIKLKSSILSNFIIKISMQTLFYFYLYKVIIKLIEIIIFLIINFSLLIEFSVFTEIYWKFIIIVSFQLLFYYIYLRPRFMVKIKKKII